MIQGLRRRVFQILEEPSSAGLGRAVQIFLIVLIWHITGAHLSPEAFPIDTSIFTGKIRKEKLKHEHALEYEDLFGKE